MTNKKTSLFRPLLSLALLIGLSGCAATRVEIPSEIVEKSPPNMPIRTLTGFTEGLMCMDRMFRDKKVEPIYVTAASIPDASEGHGAAGHGAREMLISTVSMMSQESGAIRYIAYDRTKADIIALQSSHPDKAKFKAPDFFLSGAITQLDKSPFSKQHGLGVSIGDIMASIEGSGAHTSNSVTLSTIALDMNMGMISTFQILPGITSANSMTVMKRGMSTEVSLSVEDIGAVFNLNENVATPLSTALRSLVEVGAIEMFGKLYNLPYWNCLADLGVTTEEQEEARRAYHGMFHHNRVSFVAEQLKKQGFMATDASPTRKDGKTSDAMKQAVAHYKAVHALSGNGLVNEKIFEKLYLQSKLPANANNETATAPVSPWLHKAGKR